MEFKKRNGGAGYTFTIMRENDQLKADLAAARKTIEQGEQFRKFIIESGHARDYIVWAARSGGDAEFAEFCELLGQVSVEQSTRGDSDAKC